MLSRQCSPVRLSHHHLGPVLLLAAILGCSRAHVSDSAAWPAIPDSTFSWMITGFSEPERYFDTDNLISNEATYLEVVDALTDYGIIGGAYLGVGPDQNFSYIARIRPKVAFIVDVRRDNLLQHLWYKALFVQADSRIEFLSLLAGKPPPANPSAWEGRPLGELLNYVDRTATDSAYIQATIDSTITTMERFMVNLSSADVSAVRRIHRRFVMAGFDLRFTTHGRAPRLCYPSYRDLLLDGGAGDEPGSFLATTDAYRFVRDLQQRNLVIPVVGDLAGSHALAAIGDYLDSRSVSVSAFYTSNVEYYLLEDGVFGGFVNNLEHLPTDTASTIIRSVFSRSRRPSPATSCSYQTLQRIQTLLTDDGLGGYISYLDLVTRRPLPLR